jgi:tRNA 2-thiouridine synthesizing protein A
VGADPEPVYVDARGLSCPLPVIRATQAIRTVPVGGLVVVEATDGGAPDDFAAWCRATGQELVRFEQDGGLYRFTVRRLR